MRKILLDQWESPYGEQLTHSQAVSGVNHVGL
jgi:hypothetical protein